MGWLQKLGNLAGETSASSATAALRALVNARCRKFGALTRLEINREAKSIHAVLELKGESVPIAIDVADYHVSERDGKFFLKLGTVTTSREWITALANEAAADRELEIPPIAKFVL